MKVYEALADCFVQEGASDVFGMMGDANMHWMNAVAERGARLYQVRHEGCALGMADGWARATGRPGVASTTSGPGVSQLATSLLAASRAGTPLVVFCGEVPLGDESAVQYLDQRRFAHATEAEFVHVAQPDKARDAAGRAFYQARMLRRPVLLSAPVDVQKADYRGDPDYLPSKELTKRTPRAAPQHEIVEAAKIIASSRQVVVLAGRGARDAGADAAILELLELCGGILATTLQTKLYLSDRTDFHAGISGLYGSKASQSLLQDADCVVAIGASLNHYTIEYGYLYPEATFIQIDHARSVITGTGRPAEHYLEGDARLTTEQLAKELAAQLRANHRTPSEFRTADVAATLSEPPSDPAEYLQDPDRIDPREAINAIDGALPGEIPVVLGSGHQTDFGTMLLRRHRRIVSNYGMFGAIGQAPLIAMGWTVGTGNRPTVVIEGDASFVMHLAEFDTACRYGWPLLVIVMNDEGLGAEFHKSKVAGLREELSLIPSTDLGAVARAMGGQGVLVRNSSEIADAVWSYVADPRPTVVDVRISREVLSTPYRRLWYAEDV